MKSMKLMIAAALSLYVMSASAFDSTSCGEGDFMEEIRYTHEYQAADLEEAELDNRVSAVANNMIAEVCTRSHIRPSDNVQYAPPSLKNLVAFDLWTGGMWELSCGNGSSSIQIAVVRRDGYGLKTLKVGVKKPSDSCYHYYTFNQEREILKKYGETNQD